ncbi:MAG: methylmalonyl Co-A mutase-associated GTPase MeaB, partial [Pseudomonadota bacterium]|nr:methylmalonyl Co-A mutase-associated GTPase MeaB [Pseudomonadota bacterium]
KAGVLEIADILVVNKSDLPGADRTARDLRAMPARRGERTRRAVLKTASTTGDGVSQLVDAIMEREPRNPVEDSEAIAMQGPPR